MALGVVLITLPEIPVPIYGEGGGIRTRISERGSLTRLRGCFIDYNVYGRWDVSVVPLEG
jgi:hypothetical protein